MKLFAILSDETQIASAQQAFEAAFRRLADFVVSVPMGYQGGQILREAMWNSKHEIWMSTETISITDNKYWNAFGVHKPKEKHQVDIVCEVNIPISGINRRIGGAFARDAAQQLILVHNGKIGGGRNSVGKESFWKNFQGKTLKVQDGNKVSEVAFVCDLSDSDFVQQLANFVLEVYRIKLDLTRTSTIAETSGSDWTRYECFWQVKL